MSIVIKKRISLSFLGEEYADSYVVFRSLPVKDYEKVQADVKVLKDGQYTKFITDFLIDRLVDGEIQQEEGMIKITKDNFTELDSETFFHSFLTLTGQLDPKS